MEENRTRGQDATGMHWPDATTSGALRRTEVFDNEHRVLAFNRQRVTKQLGASVTSGALNSGTPRNRGRFSRPVSSQSLNLETNNNSSAD